MTWDAVATLVTGLLAVAGAVVVGLRQVGISREQTAIAGRQANILAEQTNLAKLTFRESMFDRRMEVYDAVQSFLGHIMQYAASPPPANEQAFLESTRRARFLFRPDVSAGLMEIWKKACAFRALKAVMDHTYATENHYGEGNPAKETEMLQWFVGRVENLPELFGEELELGQDEA